MPLADLLGALERDATDEAGAIAAVAAVEVARIDAASARACSDCLGNAVKIATDEQRALAGAVLADADRRQRRAVLEARAAMLERIGAAVRDELPALVDAALRAKLAAAAARYGEGTLREVPTGVIVECADGTRIDATLDAMLDRSWPRLAAEALALVDQERS
jgi:vacuolar-type H+-ATPase subunit E/Vma4